MTITYLDTSALVKLVVQEAETVALRRWLRGMQTATSILARVELLRASRRHGADATAVARQILDRIDQVVMTPDILADASELGPPVLRTLDAIHVATARRIGSSLHCVVAYDERMLGAARDLGLPVASPR